jgi:hypothetical protein
MSFEVTLVALRRFLAQAIGIDLCGRQRVAIARMPANFLR